MNDDAGGPRREQSGAARWNGRRRRITVAELSTELANLARQHGFDALGYILDMARLEAENATRHVNGRR